MSIRKIQEKALSSVKIYIQINSSIISTKSDRKSIHERSIGADNISPNDTKVTFPHKFTCGSTSSGKNDISRDFITVYHGSATRIA